MLRWLAGNAFLAVPQGIAPIGLALAASSVGLPVKVGAAMFAAMLLAQIVGAVPIARLGRSFHIRTLMRTLLLFRGLAFSALALVTTVHPQPVLMVSLAALAGSTNGVLYALMRVMLSSVIDAAGLPRALGLVATLNEVIFVLSPAFASMLGLFGGLAPLVAMAIFAFAPLTVLGLVLEGAVPQATEGSGLGSRATMRRIAPLLYCGFAVATGVGAIEVGAVPLTGRFDLDLAMAAAFPVTLCVSSAVSGLVLSWLNRRPRMAMVAGMYGVSALGQAMVLWAPSVWLALGGTVLIGLVLAPTVTYLWLTVDDFLPHRLRAEGFAVLRTAQASGLVLSSSLIAFSDVAAAVAIGAVLAFVAAATVLASLHRRSAAETAGHPAAKVASNRTRRNS